MTKSSLYFKHLFMKLFLTGSIDAVKDYQI